MTQPPRPSTTPDAVTAAIGRRLGALRKAAGIRSQARLGELMSAHGVLWSRVSVEKLENGRRGAITLQELLVLAKVLNVSPVLLIADPRGVEQVPVGDEELDVWDALFWMLGTRALDPSTGDAAGMRLLQACFTVSESLRELGVVLFDSEETDRRHRIALNRLVAALQQIEQAGAPVPVFNDALLQRSDELGIKIPGQGG